jgi:hypothetical protein
MLFIGKAGPREPLDASRSVSKMSRGHCIPSYARILKGKLYADAFGRLNDFSASQAALVAWIT